MKTAIIYLSKHGTTEKVARMIQSRIPEKEVILINQKIAHIEKTTSNIREEAIELFVQKF